jgi:RNA ligase
MRLVDVNEAFYFVDHNINGVLYRVFTYRLASYTDFLEPDALECRGHMFRVDGADVELVSAPLEKFFNLNENPMTMNLDLSDVRFVHEKRDGSLISTFFHEDMLCLKSKTAIASDQALEATNLLNKDEYFRDMVQRVASEDSTVIMEYTSPKNRIVLPYQECELRVLAVRNNSDLSYWDYDLLYEIFGHEYMVEDHTHMVDDSVSFAAEIPTMKGIEGFIMGLGSGQRIKIKTEEYFSLHRAKDSIQSNRRLFEVAVRGATDDLRSLFHDDAYTLNRIEEMERIAGHALNSMVHSVESFHKENKHLDRKSYAIKGQNDLNRMEFNCAMRLFTGGTVDYEEMLVKNFKQFVEDNDDV